MIFGYQSSIIHTSVDILIDIQAGISLQGHSAMDIFWIALLSIPLDWGREVELKSLKIPTFK